MVRLVDCLNKRLDVRNHRAPKGVLRLVIRNSGDGGLHARKHRASKGALRRDDLAGQDGRDVVRKHRAPKGALRRLLLPLREHVVVKSESTEHQKVH